jgi:HTH-type transcriptional regulator/antitoxin HigA
MLYLIVLMQICYCGTWADWIDPLGICSKQTGSAMKINSIRSRKDCARALKRIECLMELNPSVKSPEGEELDILVTLVDSYEDKHFPIEAPDPIEAIKFRMEQMGLSRRDMVKYIGNRGRVSEILNRRRSLSITMIRTLTRELNIPAEVLVREYGLRNNT